MASESIFITCYYNGNLIFGENDEPSYIGGQIKPIALSIPTTYEQLVERIYKGTKIKRDEYTLKLVCKWMISETMSRAFVISDEEDMEVLYKMGKMQRTVEIYVETEAIINTQVSEARGPFTRMLDEIINTQVREARGQFTHMAGGGENLNVMHGGGMENEITDFGEHGTVSTDMDGPYVPLSTQEGGCMSNIGASTSRHVEEGEMMQNEDIDGTDHDDNEEERRVDSMIYAEERHNGDTAWIAQMVAANTYVEFEDELPDEGDFDNLVRETCVTNMCEIVTVGARRRIDNGEFKVGDLFDTKKELIDAITEWSIKHNVTFRLIKTNKTSYM